MGTTGRILVTGAGGQVGRSVLDQLVPTGARIRVSGRKPENLTVPDGVEVVRADYTEPDSLTAALDGVRKVFLYAVPDGIANFVAAARAAEVEHVVLLSSHTVIESFPGQQPIVEMHRVVEQAIVDSGIPYTFLRPANFATNILMWGWPEMIRGAGVLRFGYPESHSDAIHEADIAEVGVRALTEPGHEGQGYFLTGPTSVTQREQAEIIGEVIGRPVRYDALTHDEFVAELRPIVPSWVLDALLGYWVGSDGRPSPLTTAVQDVTGHPARSFHQWAIDHAADFTS